MQLRKIESYLNRGIPLKTLDQIEKYKTNIEDYRKEIKT